MGINSSFITSYCTQLKFDLTEPNLLSIGYEQLQQIDMSKKQINTHQLYQHYQTKKLYSLTTIICAYDEGAILGKALQALQLIKNDYLCNVLFSSVKSNSFNIISRTTQIKLFIEHSPLNLEQFVNQKIQKIKEQPSILSSQNYQFVLPFSNIEIANFVRNIAGILSEIQTLSLPIYQIQPSQFMVIPKQSNKIKYQIDFEQFLTLNDKNTQNSYFSPQFWSKSNSDIKSLEFTQTQWKQRHEKNVIFSFGILILHYLLLQPLYDCYNHKSKQFCQSQLQNKLNHLSKILEARHEEKQKSIIRPNSSTEMTQLYMERVNTEEKIQDEEPFELILYEIILKMLAIEKAQRIGIEEFKKQSKKLMEKVAQEYTMTKSSQSFMSSNNIQKAHDIAPRIKSISNQSNLQSFDDLKMKKTFSENQANTAHSFLQRSQSRSTITHLKPRQVLERQRQNLLNQTQQQNSIILTKRKTNTDKENLHNNNKDLEKSDVKSLKGSIRKLCGYKKMKISDNSYIEGFFQNDKAHGLGKITRSNGQTIQCIFHNNEIIESIKASPKH